MIRLVSAIRAGRFAWGNTLVVVHGMISTS